MKTLDKSGDVTMNKDKKTNYNEYAYRNSIIHKKKGDVKSSRKFKYDLNLAVNN